LIFTSVYFYFFIIIIFFLQRQKLLCYGIISVYEVTYKLIYFILCHAKIWSLLFMFIIVKKISLSFCRGSTVEHLYICLTPSLTLQCFQKKFISPKNLTIRIRSLYLQQEWCKLLFWIYKLFHYIILRIDVENAFIYFLKENIALKDNYVYIFILKLVSDLKSSQ
jgi:hypothetical protein